MNKYLIIAIATLLIIALAFGYSTIAQSFRFVETQFNAITGVSNTILKVMGIDFDNRIDYFLPSLDNKSAFGTFYNEDTQQIEYVSDRINSYLPTWLTTSTDDRISIKVYPTFYSVDFIYNVTNFHLGDIGSFGNFDTFQSYIAFSKEYCLRLELTIPDYEKDAVTNVLNTFDVYIFYHNDELCYYVLYSNELSGTYSHKLNSLTEYIDEKYRNTRLNGKYKERLLDFNDNFLRQYNYDGVDKVQNTGVYLNMFFDQFLKGE